MKKTNPANEFAQAVRVMSCPNKVSIMEIVSRQAVSTQDIATLCGISERLATYHIMHMQRMGYVYTARDPADRRVTIVHINWKADVVPVAMAAMRKIRNILEKKYKEYGGHEVALRMMEHQIK